MSELASALRDRDQPDEENIPPSVPATSEEQKFGRQIYSVAVKGVLDQVDGKTDASSAELEAVSKFTNAWRALDATCPEAEFWILKSIISKIEECDQLRSVLFNPSVTKSVREPISKSNGERSIASSRRPSTASSVYIQNESVNQQLPPSQQKSPIEQLLYARWLEGLRSR